MTKQPDLSAFWRDRNVFVTGATGLLGSWMCDALVRAGASVTALVRDEVPRSNLHRLKLISRVSQVRGELQDYGVLARALAEYEVDTIFHLGAQTIVGIAATHPLSTFESNVRGTWNLLEAARNTRTVKRIVVASTDKVYGDNGKEPYREDTPLLAVAPYDVSKACADQITLAYHRYWGLPVVTTRFGNLYGGGDLNWNRIVPGTIRSALRGEKPIIRSNGLFVRDYIYVKDAVAAYAALAERAADADIVGRPFNFSDEAPRSVVDICRATLRACGREDLEPIVQNGATDEIPYQALSAARARAALGWKAAYTLDRALAETVDWYREYLRSEE
jgi:CDP-glucose 4,6-dehydratase